MKNLVLKLKQPISYIFSLKSKTLMILLGTFVPFFACHIMASARKKVIGGKYLAHFYISFLLFLILYAVETGGYFYLMNNPSEEYLPYANVLFLIILLLLYLLGNLVMGIIYYEIIYMKKDSSNDSTSKNPSPMKPTFILLLFLLLYPIQAFSQYSPKYKIKTGGSLELGYEDRLIRFIDNHGDYYGYPWLMNKGFASISLNASYRKFFIYTDVKTYFEYEKIYVYNPVQIEYWIGMNYKIERFEFCVEHLCSHSISSNFFHEAHNKASVKIKLW